MFCLRYPIARKCNVSALCCALCGRAAPGLTRHHLVPRTLHKRACTRRNFSRAELYTVTLLCRPCHKQIHAVFTESELARGYASTEALAAHPKIARFVEWIARQPRPPISPCAASVLEEGQEKTPGFP
jgi:hypothetical protein